MNRKIIRALKFGSREVTVALAGADKRLARNIVRRAARQPGFVLLTLEAWLRSQPNSTRRGVARGNFVIPFYVNT